VLVICSLFPIWNGAGPNIHTEGKVLVVLTDVGYQIPEGSANLRVDPPMNNQEKRIHWAKDYVILTSAR
jgi:hypothetical protein